MCAVIIVYSTVHMHEKVIQRTFRSICSVITKTDFWNHKYYVIRYRALQWSDIILYAFHYGSNKFALLYIPSYRT